MKNEATHFIEQFRRIDDEKKLFSGGVQEIKYLERNTRVTSKSVVLKTVCIFKITYKK
jgi:ABC-type phosphonate transport system ATPase subunit